MFIKVSENAGERLRATFRMPEKQPPDDDHGYFDPQSTREFYRYITLVLTEDARGLAKTEFEVSFSRFHVFEIASEYILGNSSRAEMRQ